MEKVLPYEGQNIVAESASMYLDIDSIVSGCNSVIENVSELTNIVNQILNSASEVDADSFSVYGNTIDKPIEDCCNYINSVQSAIQENVLSLLESAVSQYNKIQRNLNENAIKNDNSYNG